MLKRTRHFFRYRHRRWAAAGLLVVCATTFTLASVKLTSKSSFCKSCHLMESYHASWQQDVHNKIECVKCHIAPGVEHIVHAKLDGLAQMVNNVLGRASTRPSAHVSDDACTRPGCHVGADLGTSAREGRGYLFDHQAHLDLEYLGIKVHCTTCHSYVRGDMHFEVNTNACLTCHLVESPGSSRTAAAPDLKEWQTERTLSVHAAPSGAAANGVLANSSGAPTARAEGEPHASSDCRTCHTPPSEPINAGGLVVNHSEYIEYGASCTSCHRGVTASPLKVEDSRCLSCHGFGMERAPDIGDLHRLHAGARHKVQCFNCHGLMQHGPQVQAAMVDKGEELDCRACHSNSHQMQRAAYMREMPAGHAAHPGTSQLEAMPVSPMFLAHVACTACHVEPDHSRDQPRNGTVVARASAAGCDTCHRPGLGEKTIPLWQRTTRELYEELRSLMPTPAQRASATPEASRLLHEAEQLMEVVRLDGSWGVHNPRYTQQILQDARSKMLQARELMGEGRQ